MWPPCGLAGQVLEWPGQVVIAVGCVYWTREAADAIVQSTLPEYAEQCTEELVKIVGKVGTATTGGTTLICAVHAVPPCKMAKPAALL